MPVTPSIGLTATTFDPSGVVSAIISGRRATRDGLAGRAGQGRGGADLVAGQRQPTGGRIDDLRLDRVERADERRDERGGREVVDLERRADLLDPALAHHHDPVGQLERLLLVVGDVDGRDPELALDLADLVAQGDADLGVERGERLVEQQDRRLEGERPRQRDALLLAAGQLVRDSDRALSGRWMSSSSSPTRLVDRRPVRAGAS